MVFTLIPLLASCSKKENDIVCGGACPPIIFRDHFPNLGDGFFDYLSELQKENQTYIDKLKKRNLKCEPCARAEPYNKIIFYKFIPYFDNETETLNLDIEYSLHVEYKAEYVQKGVFDEEYNYYEFQMSFYDFNWFIEISILDTENKETISKTEIPIAFDEKSKLNNKSSYYNSPEEVDYLCKVNASLSIVTTCTNYYWFKYRIYGSYDTDKFNMLWEPHSLNDMENVFIIINKDAKNTLLRDFYYYFQGIYDYITVSKINS
ncbi:MAG: hypothetical protein IJ656_01955 [Bacilli bacterium]|nr:hypothetical protein [Bacilli bacterium]